MLCLDLNLFGSGTIPISLDVEVGTSGIVWKAVTTLGLLPLSKEWTTLRLDNRAEFQFRTSMPERSGYFVALAVLLRHPLHQPLILEHSVGVFLNYLYCCLCLCLLSLALPVLLLNFLTFDLPTLTVIVLTSRHEKG